MTDSSQTAELAAGFWTGQRSEQTLLKKLCRLWKAQAPPTAPPPAPAPHPACALLRLHERA